jgi:hypothetical protein
MVFRFRMYPSSKQEEGMSSFEDLKDSRNQSIKDLPRPRRESRCRLETSATTATAGYAAARATVGEEEETQRSYLPVPGVPVLCEEA